MQIFTTVVLILFIIFFSKSSSVDALLGPNITLYLPDPGTFSTTYSPRRIAVQINLTFTADSNVLGPIDAYIPVSEYSTICKFTRFKWSNVGTLNSSENA